MTTDEHPLERRRVLASLVAAVAAMIGRAVPVAAQAPKKTPFRIDLHHHVLPPKWIASARTHKPDNTWGPNIVGWTPAISIEQMDKHAVAYAVTELGLPGVWWAPPADAAALARYSNEYVADMQRTYPGRFGMFATIPLPYVDETLKEIEYAYDTLKADGIGLLTSYGPIWPGDRKFAPVWQELNRRGAVIHVHPTAATCCIGLIPGVGVALEEYLFDTARAITSLLISGTLARYPNLRFIFSHSGGAYPDVNLRVEPAAARSPELKKLMPNGPAPVLHGLYFDLAGAINPISFGGLQHFTTTDRMVFGTDLPYQEMDNTTIPLDREHLSKRDYARINTGNALDLFPHLKGRIPEPT